MIKREKIELVKRKGIFAGIDIAESRHCIRFIDNLGQEKANPLVFLNNREGLEKLERYLKGVVKVECNVLFGVEPSGDYWKPLAHYLRMKGYEVVLVNPYHLKRTKEIIDNTQDKTDKKDSYLIADLIRQGKYFFPIIPEGVYAELREASIAWERTTKELRIKRCYLSNFLAKYFPEYRDIFSDILGKTSFYILKHFPLPKDITRIGLKRLFHLIKKVSRGRISDKKIYLLYERAKGSIGLKGGGQTAKIFLKEILLDIERLKTRRKRLKEIMEGLLLLTGYKEYLLSIPGVGIVSACLFLGEIGNPCNYGRSCQIEKLAGLNLVENSSGKRKGEKKISKRGRNILRYVGYLVAQVAVSKNPDIRALYRFKLQRSDKEKMKVLTSIAAKMLRIMFIVCKKKVFYNPEEIRRYFNRDKTAGVRSGDLHNAPYIGDNVY